MTQRELPGEVLDASGAFFGDAPPMRPVLNLGKLYAATIFVASLLLFLVQPTIARYVLPWFGGTPAVWGTCLLFFQLVLLLGYAYAHFLIRRMGKVEQACIHVPLLVGALLLLPIVPSGRLAPTGGSASKPVLEILLLLTATVGLPFFVLSSTTPLLQAWYARTRPGEREAPPYWMYGLSNAAALLALIAYPFGLEPYLSRWALTRMFTVGLVVFAIGSAACALHAATWRGQPRMVDPLSEPFEISPRWKRRGLWMVLAGLASALLLATTNEICQDIAVVPLLWIAPLAVYLLSFIVCFTWPAVYRRDVFLPLMMVAAGAVCTLLLRPALLEPRRQIAVFCAALLMFCMACHGELVRLRPRSTRHLTGYYFWIAMGGACGSAIVVMLAPLVFKGFYELHLGIALACGVCLGVVFFDPAAPMSWWKRPWLWLPIVPAYVFLVFCLFVAAESQSGGALLRSRNFYGVLSVHEVDADKPDRARMILQHGNIVHGIQFTAEGKRRTPTTYYGPTSGVGIALQHAFLKEFPRTIGVVGLGTGTLAVYANPSDTMVFYEINPAVIGLAFAPFDFFPESACIKSIVASDARLSLESEPRRHFDMLVLDAFNGDAIPIHLLTLEAFSLYIEHLELTGIIAVHVTNRYLDLRPVVARAAIENNMTCVWIPDETQDEAAGHYASEWMLLSRDPDRLAGKEIQAAKRPLPEGYEKFKAWTDNHASLWRVFR